MEPAEAGLPVSRPARANGSYLHLRGGVVLHGRRIARVRRAAGRPSLVHRFEVNQKRYILNRLARPGCMFCRDETEYLRTSFFWYLSEQYFEPHTIERMRRSRGFCRRHTDHLLRHGSPSKIASIYESMIPPFIAALRSAESASSTPPARNSLPLALLPAENCGVCEGESREVASRLLQLQALLDDDEVQETLRNSSAVCLFHFLSIAPLLNWVQTRCALGSILGQLQSARGGRSLGNAGEWASLVYGRDLDVALRSPLGQPGCRDEYEPPVSSSEPGSWSPTIAALQRLLARPGCPICRARYVGLKQYFAWLGREICRSPLYQWGDALWLCRTHGWDFVANAPEEPAVKLAATIAAYWQSELATLALSLSNQPPASRIGRLLGIPASLRRFHADSSETQPFRTQGGYGGAVRAALESPARRLAKLRGPALRRNRCPACGHLHTVADRTSDLLVRALTDPSTSSCYQQSSGLCFRDLPLAVSLCQEASQAGLLARTARVRLEVLQWELSEVQRKVNWWLRYEPKANEQSAWSRAVSQVTGACLGSGVLVGLD